MSDQERIKELEAEVERLREERDEAKAEAALLSPVDWVCFDCRSHGGFTVRKAGNFLTGEFFETICAKCGSDNTGEPGDEDTDALVERAVKAERERDETKAEVKRLQALLREKVHEP